MHVFRAIGTCSRLLRLCRSEPLSPGFRTVLSFTLFQGVTAASPILPNAQGARSPHLPLVLAAL
jgi:hypothetical protein